LACLDSDFMVDLLRMNPTAHAKLGALLSNGMGVCTTAISASELFEGAYLSARPAETMQRVRGLLDRLIILDFDFAAADIYGRLSAGLKRKGQDMADFDLAIASIALSRKEVLITKNMKHFARIDGLMLDSW